MAEQTITLPLWIVQKVISALSLTVTSIDEACCLKRQCASAANYLKLCLEKPDATDEDFQRIAISYLDNEVDTIVKISEDHVLRILPKKRDEASTGCIWYVRMNGVWFFADTLAVRPEDRAPKEDVELISKYL